MDVGRVVRVVSAIGGVVSAIGGVPYIRIVTLMVNTLFVHVGNAFLLYFNMGGLDV